MNIDDFTEMHMDVMKEIGNVGAGNAATSLSQMLATKVDMRVPKVDFVNFDVLHDMFGGADKVVVGVLLVLKEDVEGTLLVLLSGSAADYFVEKLLGMKYDVLNDFNEMVQSVISEVGNIIAGAYLTSISQFTGLTIDMSPPNAIIDMVGAILNLPASIYAMSGDKAMLMSSEILIDEQELDGHFILTPTIDSFSNIMKALGLQV